MRRLAFAIFPLGLLLVAPACGDDDSGDGGSDAAQSDASPGADASAEADAAVEDAAPEADAMPQPDAMPSNLACAPTDLPDAADLSVSVSGTVSGINEQAETALVDGATIEAFLVADDSTPFDTDTTPADGSYTVELADTGGSPVDAYILATHDDYVDAYLFPPTPVTENQVDVPILTMTPTAFSFLPILAGNVAQDPNNGVVAVLVLDCDGNPVDGATVTGPAGSEVVYSNDDGLPASSATSTGAAGTAFIFNVPPGDAEVDATTPADVPFHEHTVQSVPGALVTTAIVP